jgi:hypothetical protein
VTSKVWATAQSRADYFRLTQRALQHGTCTPKLQFCTLSGRAKAQRSVLETPLRTVPDNDAVGFASCLGPHRRSPIQGCRLLITRQARRLVAEVDLPVQGAFHSLLRFRVQAACDSAE